MVEETETKKKKIAREALDSRLHFLNGAIRLKDINCLAHAINSYEGVFEDFKDSLDLVEQNKYQKIFYDKLNGVLGGNWHYRIKDGN